MTDTPAGAAREPSTLELAHEYAVCFAEWRHRTGHRVFSVRQRFDPMTDDDVGAALDAAKAAIVQRGDGVRAAYKGKERVVGIPLSAAINARNLMVDSNDQTTKWTRGILDAAIAAGADPA